MGWLFLELSIEVTIASDCGKQNRIRVDDWQYRGLFVWSTFQGHPDGAHLDTLAKDPSSIPSIHTEQLKLPPYN